MLCYARLVEVVAVSTSQQLRATVSINTWPHPQARTLRYIFHLGPRLFALLLHIRPPAIHRKYSSWTWRTRRERSVYEIL